MITLQSITRVTAKKIIVLLTLWQLVSVVLIAVGAWPTVLVIINTGILGLFVLIAQPYYSVLLLILSIPVYVAIPNPYIEGLPMWRILFIELFAVWLVRMLIAQRMYVRKLLAIKRWYQESLVAGTTFGGVIMNTLRRIDSRLMPWDKLIGLFILLACCSLLIARFPAHGLKQIIYLINVYLLYIVIINVVTDQSKLKELISYTTYSLGIIVGLGFVQYVATIFATPYYFWQYWATLVSGLYYGNALGEVLSYSNSWFSAQGGTQSLRMFGIMPDTHSFGVLAILFLAFLLGKAVVPSQWQSSVWIYIKSQRPIVLLSLLIATFAIMAAGTRGIWVGMLVPIAVALYAYYRRKLRPLLTMALVSYALVILLLLLSPVIAASLNWVRTIDSADSFLNHAESIYDLSESSNAGRLEIWKDSILFAAIHPFGVGYGNFITSVIPTIPSDATFENISGSKNLRYNLPQKFVTAHSLYLHILVELGFAGLLAFLLFWWEYVERLWRFLTQYGTDYNRYTTLVVGLALAILWILAYGVFDVTILNDKVLQYLSITLAVSGLIFNKYSSFDRSQ